MLTKTTLRSAIKEVLDEVDLATGLFDKGIQELEDNLVDRIALEGDIFSDEDEEEDEADEEEE